LADVDKFKPAVTITHQYSGKGLGASWKSPDRIGAFVATFSH